jgi:hypothetical protein
MRMMSYSTLTKGAAHGSVLMAMQYNPASCFCISSKVSTLVAVTDATRDGDSYRSEEKGRLSKTPYNRRYVMSRPMSSVVGHPGVEVSTIPITSGCRPEV